MSKDDGMTDLFANAGLKLAETTPRDNSANCYAMSYKDKVWQDPLDLFEGYRDLKAITFSFDFSFAAKLSKKFDNAQLIVGAEFMSSRINKETANQVIEEVSPGAVVQKYVNQNQKLAKRIIEGSVEIKYPTIMYDHRKIYLLKATDGRVRVIFPSANLTAAAWDVNHHVENYMYCDDQELYEQFYEDFKTMWSLSTKIIPSAYIEESVKSTPEEELDENKEDKKFDPLMDNPLIKAGTAIVVEQSLSPEEKITLTQYDKDLNEIRSSYKEYFKGIPFKEDKQGRVTISANTIKRLAINAERSRLSKVTVEEESEKYPRLNIDYLKEKAFIGEDELDLSPSDDEVKADIKELLGLFANYNKFVNKTNQAQHNHFKLLNAMFSSVFNAKLRCLANIKHLATSGLPLFILLNSSPDCGKSFMVQLILKMMTGKDNIGYKYKDVKGNELVAFQGTHKCVPIFVDEVTGYFSKSFGEIIKTSQDCEYHMRENQPLTVFASNDVTAPKAELRKRMIYLTYEMHLPSTANRREYETLGKHIQHRMGTAFFRKYLSEMIPYVKREIEKIETGEGLSDTYSPELMQPSSETILRLIREYGFEVPDYMNVLTWDDDYADNSRSTYQNALDEIKELYYSQRKQFEVTEKFVTISMDKMQGTKRCNTWYSALPNELLAKIIPDPTLAKIQFDRAELEKFLEIKFDSGDNIIKKFFDFIKKE